MRRAAAALFLCLTLSSAVWLHRSMWAMSEEERFPFRSFFLPSSQEMKVLSFGYRSFWSDLVYIWSLLYYDYYDRDVRFTYLQRTFDVVTDLDPKNREAYGMCALFAFLGNRYDLYYAFLDKGIRALPRDTALAFEAATTALFCEHNSARAARYFQTAAERAPDSPFYKKFLAQALGSSGDAEAARAYWEEIYKSTEHDATAEGSYYRGTALRNLWDLRVKGDLRLLQRAVFAYEGRFGRSPADLNALLSAGLLEELPLDPMGKPYRYNPRSGSVECLSPFDHRAAYKGW